MRGLAILLWLVGSAAFAETDPYTERVQRSRALAAQQQFAEARAVALEALALARQQHGSESLAAALVFDDLASYEYRVPRFEAAEVYAARAVSAAEKAPVETHASYLAAFLKTAAVIADHLGKPEEALGFLRRIVAIHERNQPNGAADRYLTAQLWLAHALFERERLDEARQVFQAAEKALIQQPKNAISPRRRIDLLTSLAIIEARTGRRAVAEKPLDAAEALFARHFGATGSLDEEGLASILSLVRGQRAVERNHVAMQRIEQALVRPVAAGNDIALLRADLLHEQANLYLAQIKPGEARQAIREAMQVYIRLLPHAHPTTLSAREIEAFARNQQGDHAGAAQSYGALIALLGERYGAQSEVVVRIRIHRAKARLDDGDALDALQEVEAAMASLDAMPKPSPRLRAVVVRNRGYALAALGQTDAAIRDLEWALATYRELGFSDANDLPPSLILLGELYSKKGQHKTAEQRLRQAIALRRRDAAQSGGGLARPLTALAQVLVAQQRPKAAAPLLREAGSLLESRLALAGLADAEGIGEHSAQRQVMESLLDLETHTVRNRTRAPSPEQVRHLQLPHFSATSLATSQAMSRIQVKDPALQALIDQRRMQLEALAAAETSNRTQQAGWLAGQKRIAPPTAAEQTDGRASAAALATLDQQLLSQYPRYAELVAPRPADLMALQTALKPDEALYLQVFAEQFSLHLLLRPDGAWLRRSPFNREALRVQAARLGNHLRQRPPNLGFYPMDAAHRLYAETLGLFETELQGVQSVALVLDDTLQTLPYAALLTAPVARSFVQPEQWGELPFLVRRLATRVYPSASSFLIQTRLRQQALNSHDSRPFLGIGDPQYQPPPASDAAAQPLRALFQRLTPLPETRAELQQIARLLGSGDDGLLLGADASESGLREALRTPARIVSFATHGLLPGEAEPGSEPLLALTPEQSSAGDRDGLLTASEIAALSIPADWVLLSACNTAAGRSEAQRIEGYAGLAKAFFFAGSRALLVSHWPVETHSTTLLVTAAIQNIGGTTRGEALQQAMLDLLGGRHGVRYGHPVFWAGFVLVGGD